jgi:hypothetical protein
MRRNQRHRYDHEPWSDNKPRTGVNKLPERDSIKDGVIGRERLDPHHGIGRQHDDSFGETYDD